MRNQLLRRAIPDDATDIQLLVRAAYAKWVPIIGREPVPMTADYGHAVRNHIVDVLFLDDRLAAVIEMIAEPNCLLIENVAVRPDQSGKGHGRTLLAHAAKLARSMGRDRLRLYTNKLMAENISLYQQLGYVIDREQTTPDGRQIVHMSTKI
jgi:GNAT superfamily N-acetyltransferase